MQDRGARYDRVGGQWTPERGFENLHGRMLNEGWGRTGHHLGNLGKRWGVGTLVGTGLGGLGGLIAAPFTAGASIPAGLALGAKLGGVAGATYNLASQLTGDDDAEYDRLKKQKKKAKKWDRIPVAKAAPAPRRPAPAPDTPVSSMLGMLRSVPKVMGGGDPDHEDIWDRAASEMEDVFLDALRQTRRSSRMGKLTY